MVASILGLATILHSSAVAFQLLKYAGVAYLLYMAWGMWKESGALSLQQAQQKTDFQTIALRGFLINILNPKLALFFLAFLPQFLPAQTAAPLPHMLFLGGVFMAMTFVVFVLYGFLAHYVRDYVVGSPKALLYTQRGFAGTFALLGAKLALTER